jgi:DNA-binding CsgD family transcriptional regulator
MTELPPSHSSHDESAASNGARREPGNSGTHRRRAGSARVFFLVDETIKTKFLPIDGVEQVRIALSPNECPENVLAKLPTNLLRSAPSAIVVSSTSAARACRMAAKAAAIWRNSLCLIASEAVDPDLCRGALQAGAYLIPWPRSHSDLGLIATAANNRGRAAESPEVDHSNRSLNIRESQILALWRAGLSRREIALRLHISENTVKWYVRSMLQKIGARRMSDVLRGTGSGNSY